MQNWRFAIGSIMGHKMRSFLTMIGIIIGVASVVVIMALGNGMQQGVTKSFTKDQQYVALNYSPTKSNYVMGMNLMEGPAGNEGGSQEVDNEENEAPPVIQDAWAKELLKIDGVKGYYTTNGGPSATFSYQNKKADGVFITGVSQSFFQIRKYEILAGRTLLPVDYQRFSNVMMIDETVATSLFGSSAEALNKIVSVGDSNYRVIGVFKDPNAGQSMSMSSGSALMANTQVASEFHSEEISTVYVYVPEVSRVNEVGIEAAKKLGAQLTKDYEGKNPILVGILKGSIPFMAELVKYIDTHLEMDFMMVSSYHGGTVSSGVINIKQDVTQDIKGRHVVFVEDIIDTGQTLKSLRDMFTAREAASVKIVTMLDKPEGRTVEIEADYTCFTIPNEFVVGYGLDYNENYRNLPYVGVLKEEVYSK